MPKSCIICSAVASPDIMLQYCAACQSALYCSKACQRIDWRVKQHKKICKMLNVGHGDRQVRTDNHTRKQNESKSHFESNECSLRGSDRRFFKLFEESTFEGSGAAALEMKKYAKRQDKYIQTFLLFHSLKVVGRSNSEMLSWPNSPLLVLLQLVDPNILSGDESAPLHEGEDRVTLLHHLADLADPFDYSTHVNQLILAKQLIEHGANVNALSNPQRMTPLHNACTLGNVTNLDFVELLLEEGADPNAQDWYGRTSLLHTISDAPGVAKFLMKWPNTDVNITSRSGPFLFGVRSTVRSLSNRIALPDNPDQIAKHFQLQQWRDIEDMLVERDTVDTDISTH
jgi:hypothetical protein